MCCQPGFSSQARVDRCAGGVGGRCSSAAGPPCLSFKDLETIDFTSRSRRFTTLRAAAFLINGIAILMAIGLLADGIPPLAHELESKRDAQANVAIEAFLAPLTLDEKARLYRVLSLRFKATTPTTEPS